MTVATPGSGFDPGVLLEPHCGGRPAGSRTGAGSALAPKHSACGGQVVRKEPYLTSYTSGTVSRNSLSSAGMTVSPRPAPRGSAMHSRGRSARRYR